MRTYAGVYYLVTMVFTTNKKHDAFMNTSYLSHCCQILEEKMEYPSDQLVVLLVRTQQISQSISMTLAFRNNSLPLTIIVKSFQHEIDQLRASVAAANQDDGTSYLFFAANSPGLTTNTKGSYSHITSRPTDANQDRRDPSLRSRPPRRASCQPRAPGTPRDSLEVPPSHAHHA